MTPSTVDPGLPGNDELATAATVFAPGLLAGQVVVVSGGGSGIGRATAWLAARLGARVVVCGRKEEKLVAVVAAMHARGLAADYAVVDIRERTQVDQVTEALWARCGRVDVLINSAGGQFPQAAMDFSEKGWHTVINTNLHGTWSMMQANARRWRDSGSGGSIVNIVVVARGLHGVAHTVAARAGVIALSQAVAVEWAPLGIRVNCIGPGAVQTEGWAVYTEAARSKYALTNPQLKVGTAWQIAEAAVFLSSPAAAYINGELLVVDGGGQHWGEVWTTGKPEWFRQATRQLDSDA